MLSIARQTIDFYLSKMSAPDIQDLDSVTPELLWKTGKCFVTLFLNWEVRWSAGNIKETWVSLAEEVLLNTIHAMSQDSRFSPVTIWEWKQVKIRIDNIVSRKILSRTADDAKAWITVLSKIDPVKKWILVIKKDYTKSATILPNIDPKLLVWKDYIWMLWGKLDEEFKEDDFIIYEIETEVFTDF